MKILLVLLLLLPVIIALDEGEPKESHKDANDRTEEDEGHSGIITVDEFAVTFTHLTSESSQSKGTPDNLVYPT